MARFIGDCTQLPAHRIHAFDASSRTITNRTFRKHIGSDEYKAFESSLGYGRDCGLVLSQDLYVTYSKGKWRGKAAVCCYWSRIHHFWIIGE